MDINSYSLIEGYIPPRVLGLVSEWSEIHQEELLKNWISIKNTGTFKKIKPLV